MHVQDKKEMLRTEATRLTKEANSIPKGQLNLICGVPINDLLDTEDLLNAIQILVMLLKREEQRHKETEDRFNQYVFSR